MNQFRLDIVLTNYGSLKQRLPPLLANQAQNFFVDSFKKQAWRDQTTEPWKEVKRRITGTSEYKYPKKKGLSRRTKPILVMTGALRRAVGSSIREQRFERVKLVVALPYADAQNYGTKTITQRQFMGDSITLRRVQTELINKEIQKVWQG